MKLMKTYMISIYWQRRPPHHHANYDQYSDHNHDNDDQVSGWSSDHRRHHLLPRHQPMRWTPSPRRRLFAAIAIMMMMMIIISVTI